MFHGSVGEIIAKRASTSMGRMDLSVLDYRTLGNSGVRLLVGYSHGVGTPTKAEVTAYIHKEFDGKIAVNPDTVILVSTGDVVTGAVALNAGTHVERIPFEAAVNDPNTYRPLDTDALSTASRVINTVTAAVWEIERAPDGSVVMHRNIEEDVESIMKARYAKTSNRSASRITLASVGLHTAAAFSCLYSSGDYVRFMAGGKSQFGTVQSVSTSASGSIVKIVADGTGSVETVPLSMVIELVRASGAKLAEDDVVQEDYYTQAYGDAQFAEELTAQLQAEVTAGIADVAQKVCTALSRLGAVICQIHGPTVLVKRSDTKRLLVSVVASSNGSVTLVDGSQSVVGSNLSIEKVVQQIQTLLAGRKLDRIVT